MQIHRREFIRSGCVAAAAVGASSIFSQLSPAHEKQMLPIDESFDQTVNAFMKARRVPGGALAVVKDRRLVYARGYGFSDLDKKEAVKPDALFRIASISKPFTGVAVIKLVAAGRLDIDAPAFPLLGIEPLPGKTPDARLNQITVRHLLHHTGGWDRDKSGDPMFMSEKIAHAVGDTPPAMQRAIIRYMMGQPLDFDPGGKYAYSNFGYCVLGRIVEKISGQKYDQFVQKEVLAPIGIHRMRQGRSALADRAPGEVMYYMPERKAGEDAAKTQPYAGFCLEAMDSHGAWIASAVDLVRFVAALDDPARANWFSQPAHRMLYEPPARPVSRAANGAMEPTYYACGWSVRPVGNAANYWHNGSLPGTATLLVRRYDGLSWAMLFNQRSNDKKLPDGEIDGALHRAADSVAEWPAHDLFGSFA